MTGSMVSPNYECVKIGELTPGDLFIYAKNEAGKVTNSFCLVVHQTVASKEGLYFIRLADNPALLSCDSHKHHEVLVLRDKFRFRLLDTTPSMITDNPWRHELPYILITKVGKFIIADVMKDPYGVDIDGLNAGRYFTDRTICYAYRWSLETNSEGENRWLELYCPQWTTS